MTLREFYESMGVDFDELLVLLRKEDRIKRYLALAAEDPAFEGLDAAMSQGDYEAAFRAAHSIKGVSTNLVLDPLTPLVSELVECLRSGSPDEAQVHQLYTDVKTCSDDLLARIARIA